MRKAFYSLCLCLSGMLAVPALASDEPSAPPLRLVVQLPERAETRLEGASLLQVKYGIDSDRVLARGLVSWAAKSPADIRRLGLDRYFSVEPASGWGWAEVLADLPAGTEILGVEPVGELHTDESHSGHGDEYPNDPKFPEQTGLLDPPSGVGILPAWRETYGSENVVIAVVDSGVSPRHRDLKNRLVSGFNAIDNSSNTDDGTASHGTHIAGIAAAETNNGIGIAGVCRGSWVMPIKSFYSSGFGLETDVAEGIIWAVDHGANVISMSFGFANVLGPMQQAVQYAYQNGVVMIASTGNSPTKPIGYPAKFSAVLGVGALETSGTLWSNSQTGPDVGVVAPGYCILSTWDTPTEPNTYKAQTGTSMATPFVSGLAGLILSIAPQLAPDEVQWVILETATDLGAPGRDDQYGSGRINPSLAVHTAYVLAASSCRADFTGDGLKDGADISAFVDAFVAGLSSADLALPFGVLDSADIQRYLELFFETCQEK